MDIGKINLYLNTIKFLKTKQIYHRFLNKFKKKHKSYNNLKLQLNNSNIIWFDYLNNYNSYNSKKNSFNFLNIETKFPKNKIDWNFSDFGKLWTYNLNYFDYLNQNLISKKNGLNLINQYIDFYPNQIDGLEPYPISIRLINWIKFLSKHKINDNKINQFLLRDCYYLRDNIEYHLMGNHLLENAFALLFSSYFFQNEILYAKSKRIIIDQLNEQVLKDGGHFELSTMYHNIILYRVLDCINLIKLNTYFKKDKLFEFLINIAGMMCSWINEMIYNSGNIPMLNDSFNGVALETKKLFDYAKSLGVEKMKFPLSDSGYKKVKFSNYELLMDFGNIGPDYQPGHSHSDTFNFELYVNELPLIVDTGISTYEKNEIRQLQRSTFSHNTVMVENFEQSEIWDGFRVAKRAKIFDLKMGKNNISAKHSGYKHRGVIHDRSFNWYENKITIEDNLTKSSNYSAKAMFHFHSDVEKPEIHLNKVILKDKNIVISFFGHSLINILEYDLCKGYNKTVKAYKILVNFDNWVKTQIKL